MVAFEMCSRCRAEYRDPTDRRFHAQPNACPECGPQLWLEHSGGASLATDDVVETARRLLAEGQIVAIKGLGGFHLAANACDEAAVARLRQRKGRYHKPFALMARNVEVVRRFCRVSSEERALLESPAAPIVILQAHTTAGIAAGVAPRQRTLGFMLPYTPLHHLLLQGTDGPLVLTSGNRSAEPQCTDNQQARTALVPLADYLLVHDRAIHNRADDSVVRVMDGASRVLRRARGYAPAPLPLPAGFDAAPPLLAMGGELKNTFCLVRDGEAILSQHMGDLEDAATHADYRRNLTLYGALFGHHPGRIVVDRHPEYLSTKLGRERAEREGLPLLSVQHHHAHIAACLADNNVPLDAPPVLGIALDGQGYGDDGTLWGGEFLLADYRGFARVARLTQVPLIGGVQAIREPWRSAYAHIRGALGWQRFSRDYNRLELCAYFRERPVATLEAMIAKAVNCPTTSSCGRLFDAVAAAVGICRERASYEGEAAVELEACVDEAALDAAGEGYPFGFAEDDALAVLDCTPLWPALLDDLMRRATPAIVAARFHVGLARALVALATRLYARPGVEFSGAVALSGGVFQNRLLLEAVAVGLREQELRVLSHRRVPASDGGLSLGQAAVGAAMSMPPALTRV
jgi:hydrogenase maturation protein HypF